MPLQIRISIDHMPIIDVSVTRTETFKGNSQYHDYRVRYKDKDYPMKHYYADGAIVLARLALTEIEVQGGLESE